MENSKQGKRTRWLRSIIFGILIFMGIISIPFLPIGGSFGYFAAKRDIAKGHYEVKAGGLTSGAVLMKQRYDIILSCDGGCLIGPFQETYRTAYNSVQAEAFKTRTGLDFAKCRQEIREEVKKADMEKEKSTNP